MHESKETVLRMKAPGVEVDRHRHLISAQRRNLPAEETRHVELSAQRGFCAG